MEVGGESRRRQKHDLALEHGVMGAQPRTIRKLAQALVVEPEELVKTGGDNG